MKKLIALLILGILLIPSAFAEVRTSVSVGTVVVKKPYERGLQVIHCDWTSTAGGAVTVAITGLFGTVERAAFAPVAAASPSTNYDVVITDLTGYDILATLGANRSATAVENVVPKIATVVSSATTHEKVVTGGTLSLAITNAGAAKQGKFTLYVSN